MTVILTSPVEGKQPGDTYTGPNEAYLVAEGYARKQAGPFTGPGLDNTGPADLSVAQNPRFNATRGSIAKTSNLPQGGTNDGVVLGPADAPVIVGPTGVSGASPHDGFANDPAARIDGLNPATGLAAAGGTVVKVSGYGFTDATAVQFGGTAGTVFSVLSDRQIQVTTPAKAAGSYTVTVVRPQGNLTKANAATFA